MSDKPYVYLALPTYGTGRATAFHHATKRCSLRLGEQSASLLALNFNTLWCRALNLRKERRVDYFAMLHADVEAEDGWLDVLIDEMDANRLDVISAVVPIKDDRGLTSTAIDDPDDPFSCLFRLTLKEIHEGGLPVTFTAADCGYPDRALLINTGCWVCRFTEPWVEQACFTVRDRIDRTPDGEFVPRVESEDWAFSRWLHQRQLRVAATSRARLLHHGDYGWQSYRAFGDWDVDYDSNGRLRSPRAAAMSKPSSLPDSEAEV